MKITGVKGIKKILEKRLVEVGNMRDKLRDDIMEIESLKETCETAYEDLLHAIEALSELA